MARRPKPRPRWTLTLDGRRLEVELETAGVGTLARLFCDGLESDRQRTSLEPRTTLEGPGVVVEIEWGLLAQPTRIAAVPAGPVATDSEPVEFDPPAGGRRARFRDWGRRHPRGRRLAELGATLAKMVLAAAALALIVFVAGPAIVDTVQYWLPALILVFAGAELLRRRARRGDDQDGEPPRSSSGGSSSAGSKPKISP